MAAKPPSSSTPAIRSPAEERAAAEQAMFMREVDEAVRQDQVNSAARRYGYAIAGAVALLLVVFGGWLYWRSHSEGNLERNSEELVKAIDQLEAGNDRVADSQLEALANDASAGSATAARLMRAAIALKENRTEDAAKLYEEVAADGDAPGPYRDFATIRSVMLAYDTLPPQQVIDRLGSLAVPENAWYGSAGEMVAMAYLAQGKRDQAGPLLAGIAKDENTPETLRARTRQLAGLLGYDAVDDVDETLAALGANGTAQSVAAPAGAE